MNYWNTTTSHTTGCHQWEQTTDGTWRLIHKPEHMPIGVQP